MRDSINDVASNAKDIAMASHQETGRKDRRREESGSMRRPLLALLAVPLLTLSAFGHASGASGGLTIAKIFVFGGAGGEPNVTVSPNGLGVLVDGLGSSKDPATLYRSTDSGASFARVQGYASRVGGGDWDMHFLTNKVVIAADLAVNSVNVDVSEDGGKTWRTTVVKGDPALDRPWITGFGDNVYLTMKGFDGVPYLYQSKDLGRTFTTIPIIDYGLSADGSEPNPVDAVVTNQDAYVDSMSLDPRSGIVYILYGIDGVSTYPSTPPLGAPNKLYVARLLPQSNSVTLDSHPVYIGSSSDAFYAGFNWLTIDRQGTVYVVGNGLHKGHQSAWLSYSKDHGASWSALRDIGTPKVASIYTAISTVHPGELALAYYEGTLQSSNIAQNWYATLAVVRGANTPSPTVVARKHVLRKPVHQKDVCLDGILCGLPGFGKDRSLLDYVDVTAGPDGSIWGAFSSDGPATASESGVSVLLARAHLQL